MAPKNLREMSERYRAHLPRFDDRGVDMVAFMCAETKPQSQTRH